MNLNIFKRLADSEAEIAILKTEVSALRRLRALQAQVHVAQTVLPVVKVPKPKKVVAKKAPRRTQKIMAAAARVTAKRESARLYYHRVQARKAAALQAAIATAGVAA